MGLNRSETSEFYNDLIVDINTSEKIGFIQVEFFFNSNLGNLLGYIRLHLLEGESNKKIVKIVNVTSSSGYEYLPDEIKQIYDQNGHEQGFFLKKKASNFLSFVIRYIKQNFREKEIILVICLEKNKQYLEPVIEQVKATTGEIIDSVTSGGESASFTIYLKK